MKPVLILFILLPPGSIALATPLVGDYAKYDVEWTTKVGGHRIGTAEVTITAYDEKTDQFAEKKVLTDQSGNIDTQNLVVARSSFLSDRDLSKLIGTFDDCKQLRGNQEAVTVPAGTFDSCKTPLAGNTVGNLWISAVPFGAIQESYVETNGDKTNLTLHSYSFGVQRYASIWDYPGGTEYKYNPVMAAQLMSDALNENECSVDHKSAAELTLAEARKAGSKGAKLATARLEAYGNGERLIAFTYAGYNPFEFSCKRIRSSTSEQCGICSQENYGTSCYLGAGKCKVTWSSNNKTNIVDCSLMVGRCGY